MGKKVALILFGFLLGSLIVTAFAGTKTPILNLDRLDQVDDDYFTATTDNSNKIDSFAGSILNGNATNYNYITYKASGTATCVRTYFDSSLRFKAEVVNCL